MDPKAKLAAALMKQDPRMSPDLASRIAENLLKPGGARDTYERIYPGIGREIEASRASEADAVSGVGSVSRQRHFTADDIVRDYPPAYRARGAQVARQVMSNPNATADDVRRTLNLDMDAAPAFHQAARQLTGSTPINQQRARVEHYEKTKAAIRAGLPVAPHDAAYVQQVDIANRKVQVPSTADPKFADDYGLFGGSEPGVRKEIYYSPETGRLFAPDHPANRMPEPVKPKPQGNIVQMDARDRASVTDETGKPVGVGYPRDPNAMPNYQASGVYSHDQALKDALSGTQMGSSDFIEKAMEAEYGKHLDALQENGGDWPEGYFVGHDDDDSDRVKKGTQYLKMLRAFHPTEI